MFYQYEIVSNGREDILYLYVSLKYEFSKELSLEKDDDLERRANNFIINNRIPFKGDKVYLIVDGVVVKTLHLNDSKYNEIKCNYSVDSFMVSIKFLDNTIIEIPLREYLLSTLFSYYDCSLHDEVYKAISVLFTTYAYKMMRENSFIYYYDDFSKYQSLSYFQESLKNYNDILNQFNSIISGVDGVFIKYKDQYILPFIHYSNDGKTIKHSNYPYLSSVKSLWDLASPYYVEVRDYTYQDINNMFGIHIDKNSTINIVTRDSMKHVILGLDTYTIEEFKNILHLNSNNLFLIIYNNHLKVITKGYGNSYGLSLFGANELARDGCKYYQLLNYYFPKTKLYKYTK